MLVVSYNIASWKTALREIKAQFDTLENWLDALQIDILCLQEVKISKKNLSLDPNSVGALTVGWESFWACCRAP
eukprot:Pgem_evm1s10956